MTNSPLRAVIEHLHAVNERDGGGRTDGELLTHFLSKKDHEALAAIVHRHAPMVWGVCCRLLHETHDAEDAFQATFLVLVRKAKSVPRDAIANWLYGVARQTAVRVQSTAAKRGRRETQVITMPEPAVPEVRDDELLSVVDEELSRLPNHYRNVVVLCDLEELTRKEAARQLGIPEGSVASRLARARTLLTKRLQRRGIVFTGSLAAVLSAGLVSSAPSALVASTIKVASLLAAGQAAGVISVNVATLTETMVKTMFLTKLKSAVTVVLILGVMATGTTFFYRTAMAGQGNVKPTVENLAELGARDTVHKGEPKKDQEKIQGLWQAESLEAQGMNAPDAVSSKFQVRFHGDKITFVAEDRKYAFELVPDATPKAMNLIPGDGEAKGKKLECAIYELEGDRLKICMNKNGEPGQRPSEFKTTPDNGLILIVFKRVKEEKKEGQMMEDFTAWGNVVGGLQAGLLITNNEEIEIGGKVSAVVKLRNVGTKAVTVSTWPLWNTGPRVRNSDGQRVRTSRAPIPSFEIIPNELTLQPGQTVELTKTNLFVLAVDAEVKPVPDGVVDQTSIYVRPGKHKLDFTGFVRQYPTLSTGSAEFDVKKAPEAFTAWCNEVGGVQAGLGYKVGEKRTYHIGETVTVVLRVRNVGKKEVEFQYSNKRYVEVPPSVLDEKGKLVSLGGARFTGEPRLIDVKLAAGKEVELAEVPIKLSTMNDPDKFKPLTLYPYQVGKFQLINNEVGGNLSDDGIKFDPVLQKLVTGKLELVVTDKPPEGTPAKNPVMPPNGVAAKQAEKDLGTIKPPGGMPLPLTEPGTKKIGVDQLNKVSKRLESVPEKEFEKWMVELERMMDVKLADGLPSPRQACRTDFVVHMSVAFDDLKWNATVADELYKRASSIQSADAKAWKDAFESLLKEKIGIEQTGKDEFSYLSGGPPWAVPLVLIPVDVLYQGQKYNAERGKKYRSRLKQLTKDDITLWRDKIDKFGGTKLDAAINIILLDEFFNKENFQRDKFKAAVERKVENKPSDEKNLEPYTAWGAEIGGLQAGLGYITAEKRVYQPGDTVTLVVRIRNVGKEEVSFQYLKQFFMENLPLFTDEKGKAVEMKPRIPKVIYKPEDVTLAPEKEVELYRLDLVLGNQETAEGKFQIQYERVIGNTSLSSVSIKTDRELFKLATGKLDLEVRREKDPAAREKEQQTHGKDADLLQGEWSVTGWEEEGNQASVDELKGKKLVIEGYVMNGIEPSLSGKMSFMLNSEKQPNEIDLTVLDGKRKGITELGTYKLDGDQLRICFGGNERPREFATTQGSGRTLLTLQKNPIKKAPMTAWGNEVGGVQLGVEVVKDGERHYRAGDRVGFEVKVRNVTKEAVKLSYGVPDEFPPTITDSQGKKVHVTMPPVPLIYFWPPNERMVKPGETMTLSKNEIALESEAVGNVSEPRYKVSKPTIPVSQGSYKIAFVGILQSHPKLSTGTVEFEVKNTRTEADLKPKTEPFTLKNVTIDEVDEKAGVFSVSFGNKEKPTRLVNVPLGKGVKVMASHVIPGIWNNFPFEWNRVKELKGKVVSLRLKLSADGLVVVSIASGND